MDWKTLPSIVQSLSYFAGATAAISSWAVYRRNSRIERARWMSSLYSKFYEQKDLKKIREILDREAPASVEVRRLVDQEDPDFTDYLNFFEFMGYLNKSGQLSGADVEALFDYYLRSLQSHEIVRKYINDNSKGYGYLKDLLSRIQPGTPAR